MKWLEDLFGSPKREPHDHSEALHKIEGLLGHLPKDESAYLACVGILAARIAHLDYEFSEGEKKRLAEVFRDHMGLAESLAETVAEIALECQLHLDPERYLAVGKLNEIATREQKHALVRALFHVAAEEDITEQESDEIGSIAGALLLPRPDFTAIRSEFSEHRRILKGLPGHRPKG